MYIWQEMLENMWTTTKRIAWIIFFKNWMSDLQLMLNRGFIAFIWFQAVHIEDDFWQHFAAIKNSIFGFKLHKLSSLTRSYKCSSVHVEYKADLFLLLEKLLTNVIIMVYQQHRFLWLFLTIHPYRPSLLVSPLNDTQNMYLQRQPEFAKMRQII